MNNRPINDLQSRIANKYTVRDVNISRTIKPANRLDIIWKKIVDKEIIKEGDDPRKWKLTGGEKWLGNIDMLYNRKIYDKLISQMKDKKNVLIKGVPGVGKTNFLQRLLVEIVEKSYGNIPSIVLALRGVGKVCMYWLNGDGTVEMYDLNIHGIGPEIFLSDNVDLDRISGFILHVVVASDDYRMFSNHVINHKLGLITDLTLFSFEELCEIRGNMTIEEALFRYAIIGESACNFKHNCNFPESSEFMTIPFVEEVLTWFFSGTEWKNTFSHTFYGYCWIISQQLYKRKQVGFNFVNGLFRHQNSIKSFWASKCMVILCAEITLHHEIVLHDDLKTIFINTGIGDLFESLMHRKITKSGYMLKTIPLYNPMRRNVLHKELDIRVDYPVTLLENESSICNLQCGRYGLPMYSNITPIDAVVQPDMLIQFTVNPQFHKGAVELLDSIRNSLIEKDRSKHKMLFVIPSRHKKTFKWQEDLKDIKQYISLENEVASELFSNPSKRSRQ